MMNCEHRLHPDPRSGIQFCTKCGMDESKVRRKQKKSELAELRWVVNGFLEWHEGNTCPDALIERAREVLTGKSNPQSAGDVIAEAMVDANLKPAFCLVHADELNKLGMAILARSQP